MALTDAQIRKTKPTDKIQKLSDGGGLHLAVRPTGTKVWRLKYRMGGVEKLLTLGQYPEMSLEEARKARAEARAQIREGSSPADEKAKGRLVIRTPKEATFEHLAREWHEQKKVQWTPVHAHDVINSLERDVFPHLGDRDIRSITTQETLAVLRKIEERSAIETAKRVRQRMSGVFVYAIASGLAETNPALIVEKALRPIEARGKQAAITDLDEVRKLLRDADAVPSYVSTKLAIRLTALTALRPGTIISTPWEELDGVNEENPVWVVPARRMKLRRAEKEDKNKDFPVPLARQTLELIEVLREETGKAKFLFPNMRSPLRPASENAMNYLLNRAGYHGRHVPHGFRATFSTVMNERFPAERQTIDLMLAHKPENKVESRYNRAEHMKRRRELAQIWADMLLVDQAHPRDLRDAPFRATLKWQLQAEES